MGEASCSVVEGALGVQYVREDNSFCFVLELDAIDEKQEDFDASEDKVV